MATSSTTVSLSARCRDSKANPCGDNSDDSYREICGIGFKSHIAPRTTTIAMSRRCHGPQSSRGGLAAGGYAVALKPKNAAVVAIAENREKEKRELQQLNDKFASYVERVRFLEVHNKKLQMELEALKCRSGGESEKIREMFEIELKEAKRLIDETCKDKASAELKAKQGEEDADAKKKKYNDALASRNCDKKRIDELHSEIAANEAEINLLKRRIADLEDEAKRYKQETQRLLCEIQRISAELDSETLQRVQLENEKNCLEEELNFLKCIQAKELEEARQKACLDVGLDSSQFFKSELANAIRDIRNEYDQINSNKRAEMEHWFRCKSQEVQQCARACDDTAMAKEEARKLREAVSAQRREIANMKARNAELDARIKEVEELLCAEQKDGQALIDEKEAEIKELRRRQDELLADYDELTRMKSSLEEEIQTYRRLLEGEGECQGLKQVVEGIEERARTRDYNCPPSQSNACAAGSSSYSFSIQSGSRSSYTAERCASLCPGEGGSGNGKGGSRSCKMKFTY